MFLSWLDMEWLEIILIIDYYYDIGVPTILSTSCAYMEQLKI